MINLRLRKRTVLLLLILSACGNPNTTVMSEQVREEMRMREPKQVTPDQLVAATYQQGRALTQKLLDQAAARYQESADSETFTDFLSKQSFDTDSLREDIHVRWVGWQTDSTRLSAYEQQLWSAYRYSAQEGQPLEDNVQRMGEDSLLYTQPITLSDSLQQKLSAQPNTLEALLGMWSVTMAKKEVVLQI